MFINIICYNNCFCYLIKNNKYKSYVKTINSATQKGMFRNKE